MIPSTYFNDLYCNIQMLPEQMQNQVLDYVQFLVLKYNTNNQTDKKKDGDMDNGSFRQFGKYKGKIKLSADFNEPMEDFKDY